MYFAFTFYSPSYHIVVSDGTHICSVNTTECLLPRTAVPAERCVTVTLHHKYHIDMDHNWVLSVTDRRLSAWTTLRHTYVSKNTDWTLQCSLSQSPIIHCGKEKQGTLQTTRQAMCCKSNIEARSRNHCYRGKAIKYPLHIPNVSVLLVIQNAVRMRRIALPSVVCLAVLYLYALSNNKHDFPKTVRNMKSILIFSVIFV